MDFPPIVDVLPHDPPMVLLDRIMDWNDPVLTCELTLHEDSPFLEEGRVRAVVAVEYMAQAVGAYAGLRSRAAGEPIPIGYLIGVREMTLEAAHFFSGDHLEVDSERVWGDDTLGSFRCRVRRNGTPVAQGMLSVFRGDPGKMDGVA